MISHGGGWAGERSGRIEELGGLIHAGLRGGDLDAELVVELAFLMEEHGRVGPATREVVERPIAHLTPADLARLGRRLLGDIGFGPSFVLDPGLWTELERELGVVERDVRAAGITGELRLVIPDWDDNGHAWVEFRGATQGNGIRPGGGGLAAVADAVQEVVMEMAWTVWPVCPEHDRGLHVAWERGRAVWRCTAGGSHAVAPVGELEQGRPAVRAQGPRRRPGKRMESEAPPSPG
ncbi:hypothetical protein GCM10027187_66290 [Streptosporangium sandarakinum]|uniref:Uncharacterized protein n=1 Tax=Streptosporangium sandarakinum TaxID=1260955 RepID=A0A852URY2_9ACTN|nr:hypothetical protein [Streptosporangium sandarakinum]NYF38969.1 hypothetical protein [Streptosporangium sandarakinum]